MSSFKRKTFLGVLDREGLSSNFGSVGDCVRDGLICTSTFEIIGVSFGFLFFAEMFSEDPQPILLIV